MTGQRHLGLVAAGATLLAAAPLSVIFERWTWLVQCTIAVALIAGAAALARSVRAPLWAQLLAMVGTLLLVLTWMFPSREEYLAILPSPETFAGFGSLLNQAGEDMRSYGIPVPDRNGLLFLTVLGVGGVAILVDLLTVGLRRPALAGLPMLAIYSVPVAVYIDSVPAIPFMVGAAGFLWLLVADNVERVRRFGRRFTGDGRDVGVWEPSPLAAAGRRLTVVGVAAAVLLPLAVPGLTSSLLTQVTGTGVGQGPGQGLNAGTGKVNLFAALSGQLNQGQTREMVRVTTNEPDPFYLRFGVADVLTEDGFGNRAPAGRSVLRSLPDPRGNRARPGVTLKEYQATVKVTGNFAMPLAPAFTSVVATRDLDSSWLYDPSMQVIYSTRETAKEKTYEFDYVRARYTPEALRAAGSLPDSDAAKLQFTDVPRVPQVDERVQTLIRGKRTDYDKVRAIYDSFAKENGFTYSLQTQSGTGGSDIVTFLEKKVGFCQQYAAAMAWMVRSAKIPARVAFGFTRGGAQNGSYVLTNQNLHAWTEVYFDGIGWVPFDATPAASVVGSARSEWAPDSDEVAPTSPTASPSTPAGSAGPETNDAANAPKDPTDAGQAGAAGTPTSPAGQVPWLLVGGVLLAVTLLAMPAVLRTLVRRRRRHAIAAVASATARTAGGAPGAPTMTIVSGPAADRARKDAHAAWDELIDTMIDFRLPVDPAETPRLTAVRLATGSALTGTAAEGAVLLGRAEERARYARDPLQPERLGTALREVRGALASRAPRRVRLVATVLPPSVLLRWRTGIADRSARIANGVSRRTEAVSQLRLLSRWSPRRLLANRSSR